jgi:hypothetical protein
LISSFIESDRPNTDLISLYASTVADGKKSKLACVCAAKFVKK